MDTISIGSLATCSEKEHQEVVGLHDCVIPGWGRFPRDHYFHLLLLFPIVGLMTILVLLVFETNARFHILPFVTIGCTPKVASRVVDSWHDESTHLVGSKKVERTSFVHQIIKVDTIGWRVGLLGRLFCWTLIIV